MRLILIMISVINLCFVSAYAADFTLTTNAFLNTGALPILYTCDGKDISPEFSWSNPPSATRSYALIISDLDAPGGIFYHWVVYNIPSNAKKLVQGVENLPSGTIVVKNSFGKARYNGPCPPKGSVHTYVINLYALDTTLKLPSHSEIKDVLGAINKHTLKSAKLTMIYSRWNK